MMKGSSNGGIRVAPLDCAIPAAISSRISLARSYSTISAPCARVPSILIRGASDGMTMVAWSPSNFATAATAWAWFPDE